MSTLKQVREAGRELDRADDLVDSLQAEKQRLLDSLDVVNGKLTEAKADRDVKKNALKTLAAELS